MIRDRALEYARTLAAALGKIAGDLGCELRRLNCAIEGDKFANASRRERAQIMRERLKMSYRDQSPCC